LIQTINANRGLK